MDQNKNCLFRRLIQRWGGADASLNNSDEATSSSQYSKLEPVGAGDSLVEMASTSAIGGNVLMGQAEYVRDNSSLLSLQPWIFRKGNFEVEEKNGFTGALLSPRQGVPNSRFGSNHGSFRTRWQQRYTIEPLNSMASFTPHIFSGSNVAIDEHVFSSDTPLHVSTLRPLLITDGNRLLNRLNHYSSVTDLNHYAHEAGSMTDAVTLLHDETSDVSLGVTGALIGIPPLPESGKIKKKIKEVQSKSLDASDSQASHKFSHPEGSLDGINLLCLGISLGMIFTIPSNRTEVKKLSELLKDNENLVHDLQMDLEMKDSITVTELVNEAGRAQEANHSSSYIKEYVDWSSHQNLAYSSSQETNVFGGQDLPKPAENHELLKNIEAELEAELERLEQNINASEVQHQMFDFSEIPNDLANKLKQLDPDLIGDVIQGELRADFLNQGAPEVQAGGDTDHSSTSTAHTYNANYAVSPKELRLRLHEVIQTRLEERIKELEAALAQSRNQLQSIEAERVSERASSNNDMGSSPNQGSPADMQSSSSWNHPLCLNLAGDAIDAYDEANKEFSRMAEMKNPPSSINTSKRINWYMLNQSDHCQAPETGGVGTDEQLTDSKIFERETWDEMLCSRESSDTISEGDVSDDEEGKKLIQQILEKTRQGSPGLMYAQRMLSLVDENQILNAI